jgi:predicted branched-subunit amino acid permease
VYAGSSQLAVLPLLAAGLPLWTILLTAAMVNLRFVIFSAGLAPHFAYLSLRRRLLLGYFNGDIIYLMFSKRNFPTGFQPGKEAFFWGLAVSSWSSWQVSSIAGILLASLFPDNWGLELAGTLALIPLIVSAIATRSTLAAVGIASIVALLAFDLPYRLGLPLAVIAALAAGTFADVIIDRRAPRTAAVTGKGGRSAAARGLPDDGGKPHPSGLASAQASAQAAAEAIAQANTPSQQSTPAEPVDPAPDASHRDPNRPDTPRTAR